MTKIVINTGSGFDLTHEAIMRYTELKGIKLTARKHCIHDDVYYGQDTTPTFSIHKIDRTDPALIQVVEEFPELELKIVEIPDGIKWEIHEDEMGPECVREVSRCWR